MSFNFLLAGCSFLRYFIPVIIEARKRNIPCNMYWFEGKKYDNPVRHMDHIVCALAKHYGFQLHSPGEVGGCKGVTFTIEGRKREALDRSSNTLMVLNSMRDFTFWYDKYVDEVDYVYMASRYFADHYGAQSDKNCYFGTPKYDVELDTDEICKMYKLPSGPKALLLYPRMKYLKHTDVLLVNQYLRAMGFTIIVKTRGKDPVNNGAHRGDFFFEDTFWFPHTTLELLHVSDIVVNFSSTSVKECIMLDTPLVNFHVKDQTFFGFLYHPEYSPQLQMDVTQDVFEQEVNRLLQVDKSVFQRARDKYLFNAGNVASQIVEHASQRL